MGSLVIWAICFEHINMMALYNPRNIERHTNNNSPENRATMFFAGSMLPLTVILNPNFIGHGPLPKRDSSINLLKPCGSLVTLAG